MAEDIEEYTKYERARMIGSRALQISMGAPFLLKISEKDLEAVGFNPVEIAKKEFAENIIPITANIQLILLLSFLHIQHNI